MTLSTQKSSKHFLAVALGTLYTVILVVGALATVEPLRAIAVQNVLDTASLIPDRTTEGFTNVLILGVGDKNHAGTDLTDTIIALSIDPWTKSAVAVSLQRDLLILDKHLPQGRINALYYARKAELLRKDKELSREQASLLAMRQVATDIGEKVGIEFQGVMKMDFTGFTEIIDAAGGIDIDVPETIVDYTYPIREGVVGKIVIEKGWQHMDGEKALQYARSRHSTSDFDRSGRQQMIVRALLEKVKQQNILQNVQMIGAVQTTLAEHFESTFSNEELLGVAAMLAKIPTDNIIKVNLSGQTGSDYSYSAPGGFVYDAPEHIAGSAAVLLPVSLTGKLTDWGQIASLAYFTMHQRPLYLHRPVVTIRPAGANALAVHRLRNELVRYGFTVSDEERLNKEERATEILVANNGNFQNAETLGELLNISVTRTAVDDQAPKENEVRILLGNDYRYVPFQTLLDTVE